MTDFLTPAEFARIARLHPATVRALCWRGQIPGAHRLGRRWRIDPEAFRAAPPPAPPPPRPREAPAPRNLSAVRLAAARAGL